MCVCVDVCLCMTVHVCVCRCVFMHDCMCNFIECGIFTHIIECKALWAEHEQLVLASHYTTNSVATHT